MIQLTLLHWIYFGVILAVILGMILKRDVVLICVLGILSIGYAFNPSGVFAVQTVFRALMIAGEDLFDIMLVIALMVAMLRSMQSLGADVKMVSPARAFLKNPTLGFFTLAIIMYLAATFFWPTPATALIGTILIPVAVSSGLPPIAAAMAVNLFGHGMALSGDLVLQGAPSISAGAAGIPIEQVLGRAGVLATIAGIVAIITAYFIVRKDIVNYKGAKQKIVADEIINEHNDKTKKSSSWSSIIALAVPLTFLLLILLMVNIGIRGGDSTALIGGTAAMFLTATSFIAHGHEGLEKGMLYLREGFLYSIKIFAPVIPIAGFFYLGSPELSVKILGEGATGLLFDLGRAFANAIPLSIFPLSFGLLIIGIITGLDGSGFSGLPLTGSLASALGGPIGADIGTLAAIGQLGAVWSGGGTLTAWAFGLVATAGVAGVKPMELARKNFIPVITGLVVATLYAVFFMT
jgi:hypothetical protein